MEMCCTRWHSGLQCAAFLLLLLLASPRPVVAQHNSSNTTSSTLFNGTANSTLDSNCVGVRTGWRSRELNLQPSEEAALISFRDGIVNFTSWMDNEHPCAWPGVQCDCEQVYPPQTECPQPSDEYEHVYGIDLTSGQASSLPLQGFLSPALGNLTHLRVLLLQANRLNGTLPPELSKLANLSSLLLSSNELSGTLPPQLGSLSKLRNLGLQSNRFQGSIPEDWCGLVESGSLRMLLSGNEHLCGDVPSCLVDGGSISPYFMNGTCLRRIDPATASPLGGLCDDTPPHCEKSCINVNQIIASTSNFTFQFSPFNDSESNIVTYRYKVGTEAGMDNALRAREIDKSVWANASGMVTAECVIDGVALRNGKRYYVTLEAINGGCPPRVARAYSGPILVDSTPPIPDLRFSPDGRDPIFGNADCDFRTTEQNDTRRLHACWLPFLEPESRVDRYTVAVMKEDEKGEGHIVLPHNGSNIVCGHSHCRTIRELDLEPGEEYFFVVRAYNDANQTLDWYSSSIKISPPSEDQTMLIVILIAVCLSLLLVLGLVIFCFLTIWRRRKKREQEELLSRNESKQLRRLLQEVVTNLIGASAARSVSVDLTDSQPYMMEDGPGATAASILELHQLVLVFTDIEESTSMAAANPEVYTQVQEIHDSVIRKHLTFHAGYEINTQGDAFEIAFHSVEAAICFCLKVQQELLDIKWPREVLALPTAARIMDHSGRPLFAGPRVRMGIHVAKRGTFSKRLNPHTGHVQFSGPAYSLAEEVGDCAHGGQVVMTGVAYETASRAGAITPGLCVFNHLGMFEMRNAQEATSVFELLPALAARMPVRHFPSPGLRNCKAEGPGKGLCVGQCPPMGKNMPVGLVLVQQPEAGPHRAAQMGVLQSTLHAVAQLFSGYQGYQRTEGEMVFLFPATEDAVRFCMVAQAALMVAEAPPNVPMPPPEYTVAGQPLHRGLRIGMLVHVAKDLKMRTASVDSFLRPAFDIAVNFESESVTGRIMQGHVFWGEDMDHAEAVSRMVQRGQVVLTNAIWQDINHAPFRGLQFLSLGTHEISGLDEPEPLMEVCPVHLIGRSFPPVPSLRRIGLGYRDAPDTDQEIAIVFAKVKPCPAAWPTGWDRPKLRETYTNALLQWCQLVRDNLIKFDGYECKEIEGKFTMCFVDLRNAIAFSTHLQVELLNLPWDADLLVLDDFSEKRDSDTGCLLFRGITPSIGICWGKPTSKKPLQSTGRADYFGPLPNRAARCMASASPGQVLVDGEHLHRLLGPGFPAVPTRSYIAKSAFNNKNSSESLASVDSETGTLRLVGSRKVVPTDAPGDATTRGTRPSSKLAHRRMSFKSRRNADAVELNERAQWYSELDGLPHLRSPVQMQGLGLFNLKGIAEPVSLVQAWLPELNVRAASMPTPKNSIAARAAVEDMVRKGLEMDSSSLISASALPEERALLLAKVTGPSRVSPLTRHLSGFFGDRATSSRRGSVASSQGSGTQSTNERGALLGNSAVPSSKAAMVSRRMSSFFMERVVRVSGGSSSQGSASAANASLVQAKPSGAAGRKSRSAPRRSHTVGAEFYDSVVASLRQIPDQPLRVEPPSGNSSRAASSTTKARSNDESENSLTFNPNLPDESANDGVDADVPPVPGSLFSTLATRNKVSDATRTAVSSILRDPANPRVGASPASRASSVATTPLQSRRSSAVKWADHIPGAVAALESSPNEDDDDDGSAPAEGGDSVTVALDVDDDVIKPIDERSSLT